MRDETQDPAANAVRSSNNAHEAVARLLPASNNARYRWMRIAGRLMDIESALRLYGYPLLFLGTFFEGETVALAAAFLAYTGRFDVWAVWTVTLAGTLASDQLWYYVGRRSSRVLERWGSRILRRARALLGVIHTHDVLIILLFRFVPGIRVVVPVALGLAHVPPKRSVPLNALSAVIWAAITVYLGYSLGYAVHQALGTVRRHEIPVVLAILALVVLFHYVTGRVASRLEARAASGAEPKPPQS